MPRGLLVLLAMFSVVFAARSEPTRSDPDLVIQQPGVKLTQLAIHPALVTPTGIDVDDEGRIWVVACHTHFPPEDYEGPAKDEVLVFDPDGKNRRVFYQKTVATMDLELGPDGWVFLAERDRIVRVRDADGDGVGDVEETVVTLETAETFPHNGLAGLARHGDGELVFSLGENYWKRWTLRGSDRTEIQGTGEGGVFRCGWKGEKLRRVAHGFWNPFGVCVRSDGEIFVAENDPGERPPCRLLHVVEGGDYGYQRLYGNGTEHPFVAWNGELPGTLPMIAATGEAPCGILPLGGGLLVPSWGDSRIDFFPLKEKGASFSAVRIPLVTGSEFFRPTCIAAGPKGAFYLTDWVSSSYQLHGQGRLWKLEIDSEAAPWFRPRSVPRTKPPLNLARWLRAGDRFMAQPQLFALARGDDPFLAQAARVELARRAKEWRKSMAKRLSPADRLTAAMVRRVAEPDDESWARFALRDEDEGVKFEALRWIADRRMTAFRDSVDQLLGQPDLSYRLFKAALATRNILAGQPRLGVTDAKMLLQRVNDPEGAPAIRSFALRLLSPTHPDLSLQKLKELLALKNESLSFEVVRTLMARPRKETLSLLQELVGDGALSDRIRAEMMSALPGSDLVKWAQSDRRALREEALRTLRSRPLQEQERATLAEIATAHPESADLVQFVLDPGKVQAALPAPAETEAWQKVLAALPGPADPEAGRRIFSYSLARCASCHRHAGRGGRFGPELTKIGDRGDAKFLLESILQPAKDVSPQFHPWKLTLAKGGTFAGYVERKHRGIEVYRGEQGVRQFKHAEIVRREQVEETLMPAVQPLLSPRELRDLLAFLQGKTLE